MEINLLFIGDIVGRPGRDAVAELLPKLKDEYSPDLVLANCENASHGKGASIARIRELMALGIDAFTSGDHIWQSADLVPELDGGKYPVIRPANFEGAPGKGKVDLTVKGKRLRLINLMGRVFTGVNVGNPFTALDRELGATAEYDLAVIDFHGEATSEKRMLAEYADGRASWVVGTHTHVPTADEQILPGGTAFQSDLGMVGALDSSLGAEKAPVLKNFLTGVPWRYTVAEGRCELGAGFCVVDASTGKALRTERIRRLTA